VCVCERERAKQKKRKRAREVARAHDDGGDRSQMPREGEREDGAGVLSQWSVGSMDPIGGPSSPLLASFPFPFLPRHGKSGQGKATPGQEQWRTVPISS
jgi:hypothetical protein